MRCEICRENICDDEMAENYYICPKCHGYNKMPVRNRICMVCDNESFTELDENLSSKNILEFPYYKEKLIEAKGISGENEGVVCGIATINGIKTCIFVMEPKFMMGSVGTTAGTKIMHVFELAIRKELPVIGYIASGGARIQEGTLSLMQLAKISCAVRRHSDAGLFYLSVLTNPTTGGATASFASQGDVIVGEPKATIGFAGRRVIKQVTNDWMPDNFQSAEFQLECGFLDDIVARKNQKYYLYKMLRFHCGGG